MLFGAKIIGIGAGIPHTVVTNSDLERLIDTSDEWITTRTGIKERRIVKENETTSSLAIEAAKDAIAFAGIDASIIDLIIVATSTPDNLYPSTACLVQAEIGATRAAGFDIGAACTGIIYALSVGQQFINTGTYKTVLVIGVDVHSRFLDWKDRNTCILFGDGAGAFLLQRSEKENDILASYLRADGAGANLLCIPNTGTTYPHEDTIPTKTTDRFVQMNGRAIFKFAVQVIPEAVRTAAATAGIRVEDIDFLVLHQANQRITNIAAEHLGMGPEKIVSNVDELGNTSAASIPLALWQAIRSKQVKSPAVCALVGFGSGLTWGATIVRWNACDKREKL